MRQARGLTAVELAQRARSHGLYQSTRAQPDRAVLANPPTHRRSAGCVVDVFPPRRDLQRRWCVNRSAIIHLGHDGSCVSLLSPLPSQHLELALFELPPGAVSWSTARSHAGQQCHLLLQGTVRADYGDKTYRLEEGDSILWEGTLPYRLENIGTNEARLLIATARLFGSRLRRRQAMARRRQHRLTASQPSARIVQERALGSSSTATDRRDEMYLAVLTDRFCDSVEGCFTVYGNGHVRAQVTILEEAVLDARKRSSRLLMMVRIVLPATRT